tara:strand:- start:10110 stop:11525 length:1416 start_codon:yes stop_codon:yes gene_type:complete
MATSAQATGLAEKLPSNLTSPDKYVSLGTLVDDYAKPDARDLLIKRFGDQGITGFLKLTGAVNNVGTSDEVYYFEEGRRHKLIKGSDIASVTNGGTKSITVDMGDAGTDLVVAPNDLVMDVISGDVFIVTDTKSLGKIGGGATALSNAGEFLMETLDDAAPARTFTASDSLAIVGNMHAQGSAEPSSFYEPEVKRYTQTFAIVKNKYEVNGSQATNIGYVNVGNGDYRWFIKGEMEARARFEDLREMTLLFGEQTASAFQSSSNEGIVGTEGYFSALADRGIVASGATADGLNTLAEFDSIIKLLDKQGAPAEYAMYVNRQQSLDIDDMLAGGVATQVTAGLAGQFGAFNNDADMAVQLGFKSFTRGGYTFHKHDWKLLNDSNLLGAGTAFHGVMTPLTQVVDPQSGNRAPALELNYKSANGYSREMEHWVTGGGVLGHRTDGTDKATFHYRSECALITRGANQHVLIKGL